MKLKNNLLNKQKEATVYRVIPSPDGRGYSISAEFDGNIEITHYDDDGKPKSRTYGHVTNTEWKRFKTQICSVKEMYIISKYVKLDNAAVIMCSSYPIDMEKISDIKNKLCMEFDDTTIESSARSFTLRKAEEIRNFIDSLEKDIVVLYICCDSGESRSTALCAAIMRYTKVNDKNIWNNPYYHPNILVYKMQCKAFGLLTPRICLLRKIRMSDRAFKNKIK